MVDRERVKLYIGKTGRGGGGGTRGEWADSVVPYMHIRRKLVELGGNLETWWPNLGASRGMLPAPSEHFKNIYIYFFLQDIFNELKCRKMQ